MTTRADDGAVARGMDRTAMGIAWAAGAFCVVVTAILVWNYHQMGGADALANADKLAPLKKAMLAGADDEKTRQEFRLADQILRNNYFQRRDLSRRGIWMLLCGLTVLVGAATGLAELRKRPPARPMPRVINDELTRAAVTGRRSVTAVCAVICGGAIAWAAMAGWAPKLTELTLVHTGDPGKQKAPASVEEISRNWPRFRGPGGAGVSAYTNVPTRWDAKADKGILWKSPIALPGKSSPIVWGKRIFVTGANKSRREVICFDADTGRQLWSKSPVVVGSRNGEQPEPEFSGYAAPTPVTDGRRVYAIFANGDLVCLDFNGKQLWAMAMGPLANSYGHSASLAMWKNRLIVQIDQGDGGPSGESELLAIEGETGEVLWAAPRESGASWPSPIVISAGGRDQIITCADPYVISYDPETGDELWRVKCLERDVGPSPIFAGGMVFVVSESPALTAIRPDGNGDVTESHIAWQGEDGLPDTTSPSSNGKLVWLIANGNLTCYNALDGKVLYYHNLDGMFTASGSLVGDRLYLLSDTGLMHIVATGKKFKLIATCPLGEAAVASPAFADGRIYIRGKKNLYCIDGE